MTGRYEHMPPRDAGMRVPLTEADLASGRQHMAGQAMPPANELPAFIRRVERDNGLVRVPTPAGPGQPPVAALLEIGDEIIKNLQTSHDRLLMLAERYLGPQPSGQPEPVHRGLTADDGLAVSAVRKLEVIEALVGLINWRIDAFERL